MEDQRISLSMALDISCTNAGSPVHPTRAAMRSGEVDCHFRMLFIVSATQSFGGVGVLGVA